MFRPASSFPVVRVVSSVLTAIALAAAPVAAQQLGRTWHFEPVASIQRGSIFDATSKVGLVTSGALKVAYWNFFLMDETVNPFQDGNRRTPGNQYVDAVGDLRMSVVRTQNGAGLPTNFVAVDLEFLGQRIMTRRSSAAGAGSVTYPSLLSVSRTRTEARTGESMTSTWEGTFEVDLTGSWNLSPTDISFSAAGDARFRQGRTYFNGANRNLWGAGNTWEILGGYPDVAMRAGAAVFPFGAYGGSDLWTSGCQIREVKRSYGWFWSSPVENSATYTFRNMSERMM